MSAREPSTLAKGAAASVSVVVFVSLIVHAQWGCDIAGADPQPLEAAIEPAEPPNTVVWPGASPPAYEPDRAGARPRVERSDEPVAAERSKPSATAPANKRPRKSGLYQENFAPKDRYFSSTKSDGDVWGGLVDVPLGEGVGVGEIEGLKGYGSTANTSANEAPTPPKKAKRR